MRRNFGYPSRFYCLIVLICGVITLPSLSECAEYRTIDLGKNSKKELGHGVQTDWKHAATGSTHISHRYGYADELDEAASYTISAENGEYVDTVDRSDRNHAYITIDKSGKEQSFTIDMPKLNTRNLRRIVVNPVIQYVVKYNKNSNRDHVDIVGAASTQYNQRISHGRLRREHEKEVERYYNDIDDTFDSVSDDDEDSDYDNGSKYTGSDSGQDTGNVDYVNDSSGSGKYSTTNLAYQPPNTSSYISSGSYGVSQSSEQMSNGYKSNVQVAMQQNSQMPQVFGPQSPVATGNTGVTMMNMHMNGYPAPGSMNTNPTRNTVNNFANPMGNVQFGTVRSTVLPISGMMQGGVSPGQQSVHNGIGAMPASSMGMNFSPQMNPGAGQVSQHMYGVPGSVPGQPFGGQPAMMNMLPTMSSSQGMVGIQGQAGIQNSYIQSLIAGVPTPGNLAQVGVSLPNSVNVLGNVGIPSGVGLVHNMGSAISPSLNSMYSQGMSSQNGVQVITKDCDRVKTSDDKRPNTSEEGSGNSGGGAKKPSGRGKSRRGKSIFSNLSLRRLPSSLGGHLSFMISTRFGRGQRTGSRTMSKPNKSTEMESKPYKQKQD